MVEINLLLQDKKADPKTLKVVKKIKIVAMSLYALFILFAGALGAGIYYFSQQVDEAVVTRDQIKAEIAALNQTEQRLILVRDRLSKIKSIEANDDAQEEIDLYLYMLENSGSAGIDGGSVTKSNVSITVTVQDSSLLGSLIQQLKDSNEFGSITVDALRYSLLEGYKFQLIMTDAPQSN